MEVKYQIQIPRVKAGQSRTGVILVLFLGPFLCAIDGHSQFCFLHTVRVHGLPVQLVGKWFVKPCSRTILTLKFEWDPICKSNGS